MTNQITGVNGPITGWLDGHTYLIGLMAYPIRHSMSPTMHNNAFAKLGLNYTYLCFEIGNDKLASAVDAIRTLDMRGSNVSMPNKKEVIKYLDKLSPASEMCDAVNTIVNDQGVLTGYTTDGIGFVQALKAEGIEIKDKIITLTGAGGAATPIAVQSALDGAKEIKMFNIQDDKWAQAEKNVQTIQEKTTCKVSLTDLSDQAAFKQAIAESDIYCDATSVGMKPLEDKTLVSDPSWFHKEMVVFDTVYAPRTTKLMEVAQAAGVEHVFNGIGMMIEQGAASFKLWTGQDMPTDYIREIMFTDK
ncbi:MULTISPECIES: shikimate dehydrogenase [unclassified Lactobacillus]|uniref:shikimate dehydrogenase n=1 Tax=unclassified Lactobacillus TaxID=2620435 RepID=UPI000EFB632B|nr:MULTISPECIES: shikimate dehydrogenase [unclassified Lactobacillus]RMC41938.1 shikimate dehydrogenase [Lactobacillus sp. ESL0237]RMC45545.1 shikimate dehydrogenase [Lactobacillus sp. ESL0234]RMC46931.1 shikimate dehydrogenase [Lactobacillus sp. ESL0236]RMC47438.1 shikimate dehydrogenase [Lactobacillus sp. ESL0230]